jgi:hypothetical protein
MEMFNQIQGRSHNSCLRRIPGRVVDALAILSSWKRQVHLRAFAIEARKRGTFTGVGHYHEMPVLPIRPSRSLLSNGDAFLYYLTFDRSREI